MDVKLDARAARGASPGQLRELCARPRGRATRRRPAGRHGACASAVQALYPSPARTPTAVKLVAKRRPAPRAWSRPRGRQRPSSGGDATPTGLENAARGSGAGAAAIEAPRVPCSERLGQWQWRSRRWRRRDEDKARRPSEGASVCSACSSTARAATNRRILAELRRRAAISCSSGLCNPRRRSSALQRVPDAARAPAPPRHPRRLALLHRFGARRRRTLARRSASSGAAGVDDARGTQMMNASRANAARRLVRSLRRVARTSRRRVPVLVHGARRSSLGGGVAAAKRDPRNEAADRGVPDVHSRDRGASKPAISERVLRRRRQGRPHVGDERARARRTTPSFRCGSSGRPSSCWRPRHSLVVRDADDAAARATVGDLTRASSSRSLNFEQRDADGLAPGYLLCQWRRRRRPADADADDLCAAVRARRCRARRGAASATPSSRCRSVAGANQRARRRAQRSPHLRADLRDRRTSLAARRAIKNSNGRGRHTARAEWNKDKDDWDNDNGAARDGDDAHRPATKTARSVSPCRGAATGIMVRNDDVLLERLEDQRRLAVPKEGVGCSGASAHPAAASSSDAKRLWSTSIAYVDRRRSIWSGCTRQGRRQREAPSSGLATDRIPVGHGLKAAVAAPMMRARRSRRSSMRYSSISLFSRGARIQREPHGWMAWNGGGASFFLNFAGIVSH